MIWLVGDGDWFGDAADGASGVDVAGAAALVLTFGAVVGVAVSGL